MYYCAMDNSNTHILARLLAEEHALKTLGISIDCLGDTPEISNWIEEIKDMIQERKDKNEIMNSDTMPSAEELMDWEM